MPKYNTAILLLCLLFAACKRNDISYPEGGYRYPTTIDPQDSNDYSYPVRKLKTSKEAFRSAYYSGYWGKAWNEPNLSLRPAGRDIFRFFYETVFGKGIVITLTENEIVAKLSQSGSPYPEYDSSRLDSTERKYYRFLTWGYPFDTLNKKNVQLLKELPKLTDPGYYLSLLYKAEVLTSPFVYSADTVSISTTKYIELVTLINKSGYWNLPHQVKCDEDVLDGYGFSLEANTTNKYNYVGAYSCPGDTSDFRKACQELIIAAKLEKILNIIWRKDK